MPNIGDVSGWGTTSSAGLFRAASRPQNGPTTMRGLRQSHEKDAMKPCVQAGIRRRVRRMSIPGGSAVMISPRCVDCDHWDSRDSLAGFCREITEYLQNDPSLLVHGLAMCRTAASGRCSRFEPSPEALAEEKGELLHGRELEREAGYSYPGSLI